MYELFIARHMKVPNPKQKSAPFTFFYPTRIINLQNMSSDFWFSNKSTNLSQVTDNLYHIMLYTSKYD
jgi:hypothetical protein